MPATESSIYTSDSRTIGSVTYIWICDRDTDDVEATLQRYVDAIQEELFPSDLIVINNGLGDRIANRIVSRLNDTEITSSLIQFNIPCPESTALSAAFRRTSSDVLVLLPSYPQADPKDIARMLDALHDGLDYVASWRSPRVDSKHNQRKSNLFNRMTCWFSGIELHDINSGLRAMRREVIENLPLYGDLQIYIPILAARQGFKVGEVPVRHLEERPGKQDSSASVYMRRGLDLLALLFLVRFTQKPFRFFGGIGAGLSATGGLINLVLAAQRLFLGQAPADGPMLILATLFVVLGIQMFSLGLIGELIIFVNAGGISDYQVERVYETKLADSFREFDQSNPRSYTISP